MQVIKKTFRITCLGLGRAQLGCTGLLRQVPRVGVPPPAVRVFSCLRSGLVAAVLSVFLSACSGMQQTARESRPPNVVLILADDLGHEVLNSYGGTSYETPNLDRLAAEGVRFERAYATPLCTTTRVRLMTGKYNFRNYEQFGYLDPRERTFANYLRNAGYATAVAGKWQLSGAEWPRKVRAEEAPRVMQMPHGFGFDEYLLWQFLSPDVWGSRKDPIVVRNGAGTDTLRGQYGPDVFVEFIEDFIERHRDQPFLVYYPMALVHDPFQPTPGHPAYDELPVEGTNDTTYFAANVAYMDRMVGKLVRRLEELGLRENTLILFVGDNGTDRDVISRMGDRVIRGMKAYTTDAGTHVPLIASWRGVIEPGQVRGELVDIGDLFPTLLDVAGVSPAPEAKLDAISLYPTLRWGGTHPREWIFRDYQPRWGRWEARRYVQDARYKLYESGEFYDYLQDPLEKTPLRPDELSASTRRVKEALQAVLDHMRVEMARDQRARID